MLQKLKNKKGFTLVEMIVVIAIIAILIALIAPNVVALIKKATDTANNATAKTLQNSASAWGTDHYALGSQFTNTTQLASSIYYIVELTGGVNSWVTPVDALTWTPNSDVVTEINDFDRGALYNNTGAYDYVAEKDLKLGFKYYVYMTKVGACGGVVVCDATGEVLGRTTSLPTDVDTVKIGDTGFTGA